MGEDRIYKTDDGSEPFRFNERVARVFPDMLRRSIPGYAASIEAIGSLAARYVRAGTNCYDLGCSLGAATLAMRHGIDQPACRVVAVDASPAMIERCREALAEDDRSNGPETQVDVVEALNAQTTMAFAAACWPGTLHREAFISSGRTL